MMHKAWSKMEEVPCCFLISYIKLQGHTAKKNVDFNSNSAFLYCDSSLNSPMATKWCTKRRPIGFQGHTSNCKFTRLKASSNLTQIGRFRTVTPVLIHWWIWNDTQSLIRCSIEDMPYYFSGSSIKFQGHTGKKTAISIQFEFTRPVTASKSLRFALYLFLFFYPTLKRFK